jgi:AraC-like DNA-binding protein
MPEVRSIYSRDQGIQMPGLKLHRVCLNRHWPLVDSISRHTHAHSQFLLYLAGSGLQRIGAESFEIHRGSLFFIPPGIPHSFVNTGKLKPLCLALDLDLTDPKPATAGRCSLSLLDLRRVRGELALLTRWRTGDEVAAPREAAAALRLIDLCLRAVHFLDADSLPAGGNLLRTVQRALHDPASWREPLSCVARRIGYQPDYLNRMLKPVCGLTLGGLRDTLRLRAARRRLAGSAPVAEIAAEIGFEDPNYFSRWFRIQTGCTPTGWRAGGRRK